MNIKYQNPNLTEYTLCFTWKILSSVLISIHLHSHLKYFPNQLKFLNSKKLFFTICELATEKPTIKGQYLVNFVSVQL